MQTVFRHYVFFILIILMLVMLANKLRLAYPIVLVLGGLVISFIPEFGNITINPELVFFIFLPPLLYEAAWHISWKEFWKWRRAIASFAFPIVIITSCVIAIVSTALITGFTLALGFLLGGTDRAIFTMETLLKSYYWETILSLPIFSNSTHCLYLTGFHIFCSLA